MHLKVFCALLGTKEGSRQLCYWGSQNCSKQSGLISRAGQRSYRLWVPQSPEGKPFVRCMYFCRYGTGSGSKRRISCVSPCVLAITTNRFSFSLCLELLVIEGNTEALPSTLIPSTKFEASGTINETRSIYPTVTGSFWLELQKTWENMHVEVLRKNIDILLERCATNGEPTKYSSWK